MMGVKLKKQAACLGYIIFAAFAFIYIYPVLMVVMNSLKTSSEIRTSGLSLPSGIYFGNYITVWIKGNFARSLLNSIVVTGLSLLLIYIINVITAYPFARMGFKGKGFLFMLLLAGIMFPIQMAIIPLFNMITKLHLVNNPLGLVFVYTAFSIPLGVMILSNFMKGLPIEIEEAAVMDGCGTFRLLFQIMLPLIKPAVTTILIINSINIWNDLLLPIIVLTTKNSKTMPAGLMYFSGQYNTQWEFIMAGVVLISLPMVLFYFVMQKDIVNGLAAGAVKS